MLFFAESISTETVTLMGQLICSEHVLWGFFAGVITWNPIIAIALGMVLGGSLGLFAVSQLIESVQDINFDRAGNIAIFVATGAVLGGIGGFAGYSAVTCPSWIQPGEAYIEPTIADVIYGTFHDFF